MLLLPLQIVFALKGCKFAEPFGITDGSLSLSLADRQYLLALQLVTALWRCRLSLPFGVADCHSPWALQIVTALWLCTLSMPFGVADCTTVHLA